MCKDMKDGCLDDILCGKSNSVLLRAQDHKYLIKNQNRHQLFNRYRAEQLQRRRPGRGGMHPAWKSVHKHVMWSMFDDNAACVVDKSHQEPMLTEITQSCV